MGAPIKYTCPDIDKVKDHISEVVIDIESSLKALEVYRKSYNNPLEELRNANSALREWGEEKEEELSEANKRISDLEDSISDLEDSISDLEDRISDLEDRISELEVELFKVNNKGHEHY